MKTVRQLKTVSLNLLKACVFELPLRKWLPKRKSRLGRKGYPPQSLFLAYLLKLRENIPSDKALARKLKENLTYRMFCGFSSSITPSHDTISRFNQKMTVKRLETLFQRIDRLLTKQGIFDEDEIALDATDILSNTRNKHHPDPEAGFGYKSDGERFHGYWAVFAVGTKSELVKSVKVSKASTHQSRTAQLIFDQLERQGACNSSLFLADAAYDDKKTYHRAIELGLVPLISYNPKKSKKRYFHQLPSRNWRKRSLGREGVALFHQYGYLRGAVERYQGTIKDLLNGRGVPVRGLNKVRRYIYGLSILTQLYGLINWKIKQNQRIIKQCSLSIFLLN